MLKQAALLWVDDHREELTKMARQIWENPEECLQERFACGLQKDYLKEKGFCITEYEGVPTGFMAEYGDTGPALGLLGEYDALKNLSQDVCAERKILREGGPGHGCGHNLLGVGCLGAAVAVKELIAAGKLRGIIRYYGCPAEEIILGKVLMACQGAFSDLDACFAWHPSSVTMPWAGSLLSLRSAIFSFEGKSAHAGSAPHMGRSALDAVELMNVGANYMREHIQEQNRVHYIITEGGVEPNTVPAKAAVWYNVRAPKREIVVETFQWLVEIAKGAAMMTQTRLAEVKIISGCYEVLPNQTLVELLGKNMSEFGGPRFDDEDRRLAQEISGLFDEAQKQKGLESNFIPLSYMDQSLHEGVEPPHDYGQSLKASTDVGDVSWMTPLAMFGVATWPLGAVAHTWQTVAASGSGIGFHAMHFAAKTLAASLVDLYTDGDLLAKAKEEFARATAGKKYVSVFDEDLKI
jgi:aminobenzoyl-glutamate utilization protein B